MKMLRAIIAVGAAALAIETFYEHPTRGRGLKAFFAVLAAGEGL